MLEETLELSRENNKMLRKVRRAAFWGLLFRIVWISVLVGLPILFYYYFLEPFFGDLGQQYSQFQEQLPNLPELPQWMQGLIDKVSPGTTTPATTGAETTSTETFDRF